MPGLVHIDHDVCVCLRVIGAGFGIVTVLSSFGNSRLGSGVVFLGIEVVRVIDAHAACNVEPVQNVIAHIQGKHIPPLVIVAQVAVVYPVRVLHAQVAGEVVAPELFHQLGAGIVPFEVAVQVEVLAAGEEICRCQRVRIDSLVGHVLVLLHYIACTCVKFQFVLQEIGCIAEGEVVAVIYIVWDDAVGVHCGG